MPFSGFKTPMVASSRWYDVSKLKPVPASTGFEQQTSKLEPEKGEKYAEKGIYDIFENYYDPYPSWNPPEEVPICRQEIEEVFIELTRVFGFQDDNTKNMFDHLMRMLDSRSSRMDPGVALRSLHADYIGGRNSNFKKWYFAAQLDVDDSIGFSNAKKEARKSKDSKAQSTMLLSESQKRWDMNMASLSAHDCIVQIALYLLCWGEANNIRFMPECLCFIFKCCNDYYYGLDSISQDSPKPKCFLDHIITPLYEYYRDQQYEFVEGSFRIKHKDHASVIGYDDMNQFFWYRQGLERIVLTTGKNTLLDYPPQERYLYLDQVNWKRCFFKTYKEARTWMHAAVNFNRIWIIHVCIFWYYTSFNSPSIYTRNYQQQLDNQPNAEITLTVMSLAGVWASMINLIATIGEFWFVPRKFSGARPLGKRFLFTFLVMLLNLGPSVFLIWFSKSRVHRTFKISLALCQFMLSVGTSVYFSMVPLASTFATFCPEKSEREFLPNKMFTNSITDLKGKALLCSIGLWLTIFLFKFAESYFFLTLSFREPIRELSIIKLDKCVGDTFLKDAICRHQPTILLCLMYFLDLVLFFLDTYLWYIICNTVFSVCRSFYIGVSIWTPWKNIFSRLPKRIFSKILAPTEHSSYKGKYLVSQIWNSIVIAMYREHLLSLDHVQKLIYQQIITQGPEGNDMVVLKEPNFFVSQEDHFLDNAIFESQSEAQRRITFFAQSLSTPMPDSISTETMPTFSVMIPHYGEKITLTLPEIIKEEDDLSHVTLLEYLKQLHPMEWNCFVEDTKLLADEAEDSETEEKNDLLESPTAFEKADLLPFYHVGFKTATPEYILRTRIWASLRTQTLYRTISGFMNYSRAIKLLYDVEHSLNSSNEEQVQMENAAVMALRKFRLVVSMQRLKHFNKDENENKEFLLRAYPELQIAYIDEEVDEATDQKIYYSALIDGSCEILESGERKPKYKIKLSGNPILGDGKSDNQNHAVVFCRGEYIQLVDANQDNYLEECLKIRNVLAEFEEMDVEVDPYNPSEKELPCPVAIIGTREYIFSENIGVLGDIAAGKEQTFGTLFARTLGHIGGKLHYGHPDFLNAIFMTTRGGVSKAQKGLHLNEDIYAGMNAMMRGGRIKHCEYMQCGKGRDLGFGSILNFTTKIGAGMGEQFLSREYYYLGTQLPLDRFLSFYYAHPGFHLNNVFIMTSIRLFLIVALNLSVLVHESVICEYNKHVPITDIRRPNGCNALIPVVEWLRRCIVSIFVVFAASFIPLCVQELTERGIWRAITRITKHFASLSPLFEVFVCRIYAGSLIHDFSVGGAMYIATGRGFATIRVPFSQLYSRFAPESFYFAVTAVLMLLYCSMTIWNIAMVYFWSTVGALLIAPFVFNPNQFSWNDFFVDYQFYLKWLTTGNSRPKKNSWVTYVRNVRTTMTGTKRRKKIGKPGDNLASDHKKPSALNILFSRIIPQALMSVAVLIPYLFANSQNDVRAVTPSAALVRILIVSFGPIVFNMAILLFLFVISLFAGPLLSFCFPRFPALMSSIAHTLSIVSHLLFVQFLWMFQNWNVGVTILGMCSSLLLQSLYFKIIQTIVVTREFVHGTTNHAWWSGKWVNANLGWSTFTQPIREFFCKTHELSLFAGDFILGHTLLFIQVPILLIPYVDKGHSLLLFWLRPGRQIRPKLLSKKQRQKRKMIVHLHVALFFTMLALFITFFAAPHFIKTLFDVDIRDLVPEKLEFLFQPEITSTMQSRRGLTGYKLLTAKHRSY